MLKFSGTMSSLMGIALVAMTTPGQSPELASQPRPPGWYVYPADQMNSVKVECLSSSQMEWKVSVEGNDIKIVDYKRREVEQPPLPSGFKLKPEWIRGHRHLLKFDDGWLIGIDAGEWGGGLWITNEDGTRSKEIVMDDVRGLIPTSRGIFVLSGLAHLRTDFGNVLMLSAPHDMHASFEWESSLIAAPQSFVKLADESILVADGYGIWKIAPSGTKENLLWLKTLRGYFHWINSIAETLDGTIYLGCRMIVARLRPGYSEEWLVPDECKSQNLCECRL